jgi:DNA-binding SARP family transcriptional activator
MSGASTGSVTIRLLGGLDVEASGKQIDLPAGNLQSLFAYLVLHPDTLHPRARLSAMLWPEASPERAGRNLSNLLYRLRQTLDPPWLDGAGEDLALRTGSDVWIDVHAFERLIGSPTPENLEEAVSLYRGELLPAFYDDWVLARRERLGEIHLTALLELAALAETGRETGKALAYYRRVLGVDPFREEAARGQMRTLGQDGRYSEALGYYKALERRLVDEIGVLPGLETRLLADRLRGERDLAQRAVALPVPSPFVGRVSERARLLHNTN